MKGAISERVGKTKMMGDLINQKKDFVNNNSIETWCFDPYIPKKPHLNVFNTSCLHRKLEIVHDFPKMHDKIILIFDQSIFNQLNSEVT